jgi:hypothetical protein
VVLVAAGSSPASATASCSPTARTGPGARLALRRTAAAFAVGDAALLAAAGIALVAVGNLDLRATGAEADALAAAGVAEPVACSWCSRPGALRAAAAAPLAARHRRRAHADLRAAALPGLVNAGGILLVRLGPVVGSPGLASPPPPRGRGVSALYAGP